jgi:hypothetical protein
MTKPVPTRYEFCRLQDESFSITTFKHENLAILPTKRGFLYEISWGYISGSRDYYCLPVITTETSNGSIDACHAIDCISHQP